MADELVLGATMRRSGSIPKFSIGETAQTGDMAGTLISDLVQTIGATHELLAVYSDVSSAGKGWAMLCNQSDTESIEVGLDVSATFYPFADIPAGKWTGPIPLYSTVALYARTSTAGANIRVIVCSV